MKKHKRKNLEQETEKEIINFEEKISTNNKFYYITIGVVVVLVIAIILILHFTI